MGDCFFVLTVPMEGLINTHSMGNFCSYHTQLKKPNCKADLIVYASVFLFGALKDVNELLGAGGMPYGTGTGPPP